MRTKEEYQEALEYMRLQFDWNGMSYNRQLKTQNSIDLLQTLIDRATPMKPTDIMMTSVVDKTGMCKCCTRVYDDQNYCGYCGQAIDWEKEKTDEAI